MSEFDPLDWGDRGATFVCECPSAVKELKMENSCVIAILDDDTKFLVPVDPPPETIRN